MARLCGPLLLLQRDRAIPREEAIRRRLEDYFFRPGMKIRGSKRWFFFLEVSIEM